MNIKLTGVKIASSITFLGTGGDSYVVGKGILAGGGIIIRINDNQFHIDPGPGALLMARNAGIVIRDNTAILVSNKSLYNCNDVNAVIDAMTYSGFDKKGVLIANKTVIHGSETEPPIVMPFYGDCLERFIVLQPGQRVGINEVEVQALKTNWNDPAALGFKFFTPEFTLSYSSDTKYSPEMAEQYKDSGILILNLTNPNKDSLGLSREDSIRMIKEADPKLVIITHFGNEMLKSDILYEAREIQKETRIQTIAAKDGMVITPGSYSAHQGQRTFGTFQKETTVDIREEHPQAETHKEIKEEQKTISEITKEEEQSDNQEQPQ